MFYDDEPERLPLDYFLTQYERDLLTLTIEEMVRKNPDKTPDELKAEAEKMRASQDIFKEKY
jgi:hypothetical protein